MTIKGAHHYLWGAVDQEGHTLDVLVQRRRDRQAAKRFFRKPLKGLRYVPRVLVTDKLKSYDPATRAADAAIQIAGAGPALFIGAWSDQQCLSLSAQLPVGGPVLVRSEFGFFTLG